MSGYNMPDDCFDVPALLDDAEWYAQLEEKQEAEAEAYELGRDDARLGRAFDVDQVHVDLQKEYRRGYQTAVRRERGAA